MAEHLFIRLDEPTGDCASVVLDSEGRAVRRTFRGELAEVAAGAEGRRVVLLVPGPDVVTTRVTLPGMSAARMRQTLPYSLEDQFAEDIEQLHFAPGQRQPSGDVPVSVVARERLEAWLGRLAEVGVTPHAVYADTDGVPDTPATLTLIADGDRVYGRRPGRAPFVLEDVPLGSVYELVAAPDGEDGEIQHIDLYIDAAAAGDLGADLESLGARVASVAPRALGDGVVGRFASTLVFAPGTNLLQGPYAPKSNLAALARPWYAAAGLAAVLIGLALVSQAVQFLTLGREDRALTAWLTDTCETRFGTGDLAACEAEVRRLLSAAGLDARSGRDGFLSTLAAVAEFNDPASRIEQLSYRNREMTLQLTAQSVPALDEFARRVENTERFEVRIQSANPRDEGVEGRVRLMEAGP